MSFAEVVRQHWDQIHVLSQLCVIIGQSSLERPTANVEHDFIGSDDGTNDDDEFEDEDEDQWMGSINGNDNDHNNTESYNLQLMYKIGDRVLEIAKDLDDVSDTHCVFYWTSRQKHVDLNKMEQWSDKILTFCDSVTNDAGCEMNLIELNEFIEIETYRHLTYRHLAFILDNDDEKALLLILKAIDLCSKTNYVIKIFNAMFEEKTNEIERNATQNEHDLEINRMTVNGEMDVREVNDVIGCYHFASNLCQKMNKFQQSLDLIQRAITIMKNELNLEFKDRIATIAEPMSSDEDEEDNDTQTRMEIDTQQTENINIDIEYEIDVELTDDIRKMLLLKDKSWRDMKESEKLFYFIHKELFDMILTRGLAYSNLNQYLLAFHDSYFCTLMQPKDITAWNNRAFAWYQLGKYVNCVVDCNYALQCLPKRKQSLFTRGLLIGNRGLSEYKLKQYHKSINDLNICLQYSPQSRLAREALHGIWKEFTKAIYQGCTQIDIGNKDKFVEIPFVVAKIIADYGVGIDFDIIPQCHQSTIVYEN